MLNDKKILALIPARGGSKGLPDKNILPLANKPLIAWTIEAAKKSKYIDRLILSTDDEKIKNVALVFGCEVPFMRPENLATDTASTIEVVLHALYILKEEYDLLVLLQPTSPFRSAEDIDNCIEMASRDNKACVSVAEAYKSPYWMYNLNENNLLHPILNTDATRRQDLPKAYALNGALYVNFAAQLFETRSFLTDNTLGYIMPKQRSIDVDDMMDFVFCEALVEKGMINI